MAMHTHYGVFREHPQILMSDENEVYFKMGGGSDVDFILVLLSVRPFNKSFKCWMSGQHFECGNATYFVFYQTLNFLDVPLCCYSHLSHDH